MQAVGRLGSYITRGIYTVSGGAVDIVVVRQKDGSFKSSPWYVRFGKFHRVLKGKVKVDISVNGVEPDFHMYLNSKREAIFLHAETQEQEEEESVFCYGETDDIDIQQVKSISCNFDSSDKPSSRILGIVRSLRGGKGEDGEVNRVDSMGRAEIASKLLEMKWSTNLTFDQGPSRDRKKTRGEAFNNGRDCSYSGMCDVGHVGNKPNFRKSQTVNIGPRDCSVKKVCANTPTSQQLASLNLKEGRNTITFSFSTAMGTQQVDAQIYLWKWNTRIVISDVDGTITRSDVLGQFMPLVGIDWSQTGVAHLFSDIKENGYQLLFLSARAISQAYHTRQFLCNLKQDGKVLPDGPVVISPDGLFPSLYREVIRRAPHEFKISCLEDIRALFPPECNPFYAGFGNRDTDEVSYLKVGIPKGKIFIINPRGEIAVNRRCFDTQSYTSLHALVHGMFPPTNSSEQEDFNSWNYWKLP